MRNSVGLFNYKEANMVHDSVRRALDDMKQSGKEVTEIAGHMYSQKDLEDAVKQADEKNQSKEEPKQESNKRSK